MTGRTRGTVGAVREARNVLVIARMTGTAGHTRIMVARIADIVRMPVGTGRRPAVCRMAAVALRRGDEVTAGRQPPCIGAIMARVADTISLRAMNPGPAHEGRGGMTEVTIQRCCDMGRIGLGILTDSRTAVMAGFAIVHDAGMIKHRPDEGIGIMTDTTILVC